MDHITRCPNCSTAFKVNDEQLAAYQGKVRCGRCAFVFNAREALIPSPAAQVDPQQAPTEMQPMASGEAISPPAHEHRPPSLANLYAEATTDHAPEATTTTAETPAAAEESLVQVAPEEEPITFVVSDAPSGYHPITLPEDEALFAPIPKPQHPRIWTFLSLLCGLLLVAQLLYIYRINLAMEFPALQPRLTALCHSLGCEMPLPRNAERLRLEWSELTYIPDHPTLIQLSATLRNLADFEQALPLMELTLTDTQERIVARRIFHPGEYLTSGEKKRASLASQDELHAFLQLETGDLKSTGYSLYWFYD